VSTEPTKQELVNEIACYQRLQEEQPDADYSGVIDLLWKKLFEVLERELDKPSVPYGVITP